MTGTGKTEEGVRRNLQHRVIQFLLTVNPCIDHSDLLYD